MAISIANINALTTQRFLETATAGVSAALERLSSGQRINRASDDAAGRAMAADIQTLTRVISKAVLNVNDGISMLTIADTALATQVDVLQRMRELSAQAANGALSSTQRLALDREAQALLAEFDRIASTSTFNGRFLLDSDNQTALQIGVRGRDTLSINLDSSHSNQVGIIATAHGDGTFGAANSFSAGGSYPTTPSFADLNSDGRLDMVTVLNNNKLSVQTGNGDGSFSSPTLYSAGTTGDVKICDLNGDGKLDLLAKSHTDSALYFLYGAGNGTFQAAVTLAMTSAPTMATASDLNNDGWLDIIYHSDSGTGEVGVMLANAGGLSYHAPVTYAGTDGANNIELHLADLNNDGQEDLIVPDLDMGKYSVYLGNGSGGFSSANSYAQGALWHISLGDFNEDGKIDIITNKAAIDELGILKGNGDGTFQNIVAIDTGLTPQGSDVGDFNGDGHLDIVTTNLNNNKFNVYFGNGNGTFNPVVTFATATADYLRHVATADVNSDGALDLIGVSGDPSHRIQVALGGVSEGVSGVLSEISLATSALAQEAMEVTAKAMSELSLSRSSIGAAQSRLAAVLSALYSSRSAHEEALALIANADIAQETASLVRQKILQQTATAVLGQINSLSAAMVLNLLRS